MTATTEQVSKLTVYAFFFDMEDDVPDLYSLSKDLVEDLKQGRDAADWIAFEVSEEEYLRMLRGGK